VIWIDAGRIVAPMQNVIRNWPSVHQPRKAVSPNQLTFNPEKSVAVGTFRPNPKPAAFRRRIKVHFPPEVAGLLGIQLEKFRCRSKSLGRFIHGDFMFGFSGFPALNTLANRAPILFRSVNLVNQGAN
jgi:hypothetical protein